MFEAAMIGTTVNMIQFNTTDNSGMKVKEKNKLTALIRAHSAKDPFNNVNARNKIFNPRQCSHELCLIRKKKEKKQSSLNVPRLRLHIEINRFRKLA